MASWVGAAFPLLALLTAAYVNVMKNNVGHVHRERKRVAVETGTPLPPDEQRALDALAIHTRRQNVIALVAMVPFGLLMLATEINVFSDEGGPQRFPEDHHALNSVDLIPENYVAISSSSVEHVVVAVRAQSCSQ